MWPIRFQTFLIKLSSGILWPTSYDLANCYFQPGNTAVHQRYEQHNKVCITTSGYTSMALPKAQAFYYAIMEREGPGDFSTRCVSGQWEKSPWQKGMHQRKALLVPHDLMSRGWDLRQQPSQTKRVHIMSNVATYRRPLTLTHTQLKRRVKLIGKSLFHEALPNCSLARTSSHSLTLLV